MTRLPGKRCSLRNRPMVALFLSLLLLTSMAHAQTNVIYQDDFARTGLLNGTAPDMADSGGAVWFASSEVATNSALYTDGSEIIVTNMPNPTNGLYLNGYLPFTPVVGHVYTLTESIYGILGGNQWLAMGFSLNEFTNNYFAAATGGAAWLLQRASGANFQAFLGPGGANSSTINLTGGAVTNTYNIILDTTTGNALSGWTVTWLVNGVQQHQAVYLAANPAIHFVGCGVDAATGYFKNF